MLMLLRESKTEDLVLKPKDFMLSLLPLSSSLKVLEAMLKLKKSHPAIRLNLFVRSYEIAGVT